MTGYDVLITGNNLAYADGALGISSVVLVTTDAGPLLFDTGHYGNRPALLRGLARHGLRPKDVPRVMLSHLHWDHSLNVDLFPDAEILVSRRELEYASSPHQDDSHLPWGILEQLGRHRTTLLEGPTELGPGLVRVSGARPHARPLRARPRDRGPRPGGAGERCDQVPQGGDDRGRRPGARHDRSQPGVDRGDPVRRPTGSCPATSSRCARSERPGPGTSRLPSTSGCVEHILTAGPGDARRRDNRGANRMAEPRLLPERDDAAEASPTQPSALAPPAAATAPPAAPSPARRRLLVRRHPGPGRRPRCRRRRRRAV